MHRGECDLRRSWGPPGCPCAVAGAKMVVAVNIFFVPPRHRWWLGPRLHPGVPLVPSLGIAPGLLCKIAEMGGCKVWIKMKAVG